MTPLGHYLAIIPARGGSKRIPNKNMKKLGRHPLLYYTIRAAKKVAQLKRIVVSTDSAIIASYASSLGATPLMRPPKFAQDSTPMRDLLLHVLEQIGDQSEQYHGVVVLQPTSPFRTHKHIRESLALFEDARADTVISVRHVDDHPYWLWKFKSIYLKPLYSVPFQLKERHELPPTVSENGAILITKRSFLQRKKLYGSRVAAYVMDHNSSIDIDTPDDWDYAEYLVKSRRIKNS